MFICFVLWYLGVLAQVTTGNVTGRVIDSTGGVIPGAQVVLISEVHGTRSATITANSSGDYVFPDITPDTYTAKITLTETYTGLDGAAVSNGSGNYTFPNLPPGQYRVAVEMPGFNKQGRAAIKLLLGDSAAGVDVHLPLGGVSETVEVTAESAVLKTDCTDINTTAEDVQPMNVPTSNHDPEFGRDAGAVGNVVFKSGTNELHGRHASPRISQGR